MMDRRTVVKGASWAVPAITVAAMAPALAASSTPHYEVTGFGYKCPGNSDTPKDYPKHGYKIVLSVAPAPSTIVISSVFTGNNKQADVYSGPTPVGPGKWETIIDADSSPSNVIVTIVVDGQTITSTIATSPHCN